MIAWLIAAALAGSGDATKAEKLLADHALDDAISFTQASLRKSQDVRTMQRLLAVFEEALYGIAERDDSLESWKRYLSARPDGRWAERARSRLCTLGGADGGACGLGAGDAAPNSGVLAAIGTVSTWPTLDEPARSGHAAPDDAALVIGLEDYAFMPDVPFAMRDAQAVDSLLRYTVGIPSGRVRILTRGSVEQILAAAREVGGMLGPNGRLWLYYAGHGAADPTTRERILLGDDVRADPSGFRERAVSLADLVNEAKGGSAEQIVLLDTCFAGVGRDGSSITGGTRLALSIDDRPTGASAIQWSATGPNGLSGPFDPARHGAFTYFLVGALRGWADGEIDGQRDGQVTLAESEAYVRRLMGAERPQQQTELKAPPGADGRALVSGVSEKPPAK